MLKLFWLFVLIPGAALAQSKKVLSQSYSFLLIDNEVKKYTQSNDTLYQYHCYVNKPCVPKAEDHYKILSRTNLGEFVVVKMEKLDTLKLTTEPYPAKRYVVMAFKNINSLKAGMLELRFGLSKKQLDTVKVTEAFLKDKFFITLFSETYLQQLAKLKPLTTRQEALDIMNESTNQQFNQLIESYKKTDSRDMYGVRLNAEIFNQICIQKGYNPFGAGWAFSNLMKRR